jgi:WD40 repeat protein
LLDRFAAMRVRPTSELRIRLALTSRVLPLALSLACYDLRYDDSAADSMPAPAPAADGPATDAEQADGTHEDASIPAGDAPALRVDPSEAIGVADPQRSSAPIAFRALLRRPGSLEEDVTASVDWRLEPAPELQRSLGTIAAGGTFTPSGIGGQATIRATLGSETAAANVSMTVVGRRRVDGVPASAPDWFAAASEVPGQAALEPADGTVLPANLGGLDIDFGAEDTDDVHEIQLASPSLDLRIYAPGAPGPRHLELTPAEWSAVAGTNLGGGVDLIVRSAQSAAPTTKRAIRAHLAISSLDASALVFSGAPWVSGSIPSLWRYDMAEARPAPFLSGQMGTCIGCHIAVSADGTRIAAGTVVPDGSGQLKGLGLIIDAQTRTVISTGQPSDPWGAGAFDPSGALVTASLGLLQLRDGTSGALVAPIDAPPATSPAIAPDGGRLAFIETVAGALSAVGTALRIAPWSARDARLGDSVVLLAPTDGRGIEDPRFSPDGTWLAYTLTASIDSVRPRAGVFAMLASGGAPIALSAEPGDAHAHWASEIRAATFDHRRATPFAWLAFISDRAIGARTQEARQLWLVGFAPEIGLVTHPFHLPGQPATLAAIHAPERIR